MEFLEGETLDERLKRGRLDSEEALLIAIQVAAGLDCAHGKGLIHRDLKPSNIFLTREGAKLLDFGLAKLQTRGVADASGETATTPVTGAGAIVGTLQYMAPEQLEGHEADVRSDIFSFGATLYEMVTGQRAFSGTSRASVIGSIMKEDPRPISELLPATPPALDRLIRKCLRKEPSARWQSAADLRDELEWIASAGSQAGVAKAVGTRRRWHMYGAWTAAIVMAACAVLLGYKWLTRSIPDRPVVRFSIAKPEGVARVEWPKLSPDGRYLAFLGYDTTGSWQVWIRPLDSRIAYPLSGTKNIQRPFWSPDSKYLAFFDHDQRQMMKVPVSGGEPVLVCQAHGTDGSWGSGNVILFDDYQGKAIGMVSASGGEPKPVAVPDTAVGEEGFGWPTFLPDGRHFIYTVDRNVTLGGQRGFTLKAGSIDSDESQTLAEVSSQAIYFQPGYLLYARGGYLVAQPFNAATLEFEGEPVPLAESIGYTAGSNAGLNASASDNGNVVWLRRATGSQRLVWVDRKGTALDTVGPPGDYRGVWLTHDNQRVACPVLDPASNELRIQVTDFEMDRTTTVASSGGQDNFSIWSPDDHMLAYVTIAADGTKFLKTRSADGRVTVLMTMPPHSRYFMPQDWIESQKVLYFDYPDSANRVEDTSRYHLIVIDIAAPDQVDTLYTWPRLEVPYGLSPDRRYFVTGAVWGLNLGLFIYDLEHPGRKWRLPEFGAQARWSPRGDEIFLKEGDVFKSLPVDLSDSVRFGPVKIMFTRPTVSMSQEKGIMWTYDIASDAQRFLFITPHAAETPEYDNIEVVLNWNAGQ